MISKELCELRNTNTDIENISRDVVITGDFADYIHNGLVDLGKGLNRLLSEVSIEVPEISKDIERIDSLIDYYKEEGNFSSRGASYNSLSFLKSGVVVFLSSLEAERDTTSIVRIKEAFNTKIVNIAKIIQAYPFDDIDIAKCAIDYLQNEGSEAILVSSVSDSEKLAPFQTGDIGTLLKVLGPEFEKKRIGAWETLESSNPDKLSQAANSMVELLDKVISNICGEEQFSEVLTSKFGSDNEKKWVDATRAWISQTKSNLHRVKHHSDYKSENMTRTLMQSAESIIYLLLK